MKKIRILALLLVLVLLLCACSLERGNPSELILEDTDFTYYEESPLIHADWLYLPVSSRVPLTQEHFQVMFPENAPEWMDLKGSAEFSSSGYLIDIMLETPTQNPEITLTVSIGDTEKYSFLYYRYVDGHPPTVRNDQRYYILDQGMSFNLSTFSVNYSAIALIHGVPFIVTSRGHIDIDEIESRKESIKKDFEQVLDYFTHIEKGFVENANI